MRQATTASRSSAAIARLPEEKNIGDEHPKRDEHPVLDFEAQDSDMLDEKLHYSWPPSFVQDRGFGSRNILSLYSEEVSNST
jgi:hypothetical protein